MSQPTFDMLVGLPGSGKSTYAQTLLTSYPDTAYLCPDVWREELTGNASDHSRDPLIWGTLVYTRILGAATQRKDILFDATSYRPKNRKRPCVYAKEQGYRVIAHVMQTPVEVCWERNMARERKVPREVFERMVAGWALPDMSRETYIDHIVEVPHAD